MLLHLDHAPDYREAFLRELSEIYSLYVVAHPCENDGLKGPLVRKGYTYIELKNTFGNSLRFNFQLSKIIRQVDPNVICVALNIRYPVRLLAFLFSFKLHKKWIWWGQIYGKNESALLERIKKSLIRMSAGVLVYTDDIVSKLNLPNVHSFDNSQFSEFDFVPLENKFTDSTIKCLFVGRPQKRKRLEILLQIANSKKNVLFRLVGPGMEEYFKNSILPSNVELYPAASGNELRQHFKWSNLVVNPGHVGLLVMNAACHNRPIVIDSEVAHAPEVILANETDQYFIDFLNMNELDDFFTSLIAKPDKVISKGNQLYNYAINKYTIEKMTRKHSQMFDKIINKKICK